MKAALFIFVVFGALIGLVVYALSKCTPRPRPPDVQRADTATQEGGRFRIRIEQTFSDRSAYQCERNVYVIEDTLTGCEYVGISGVGVSEIGSHLAGKGHRTDER